LFAFEKEVITGWSFLRWFSSAIGFENEFVRYMVEMIYLVYGYPYKNI